MSGPRLAPELSRWINEQLARGCAPSDMIDALVAVGHAPESARAIIGEATGASSGTAEPAPAVAVPEPLDQSLAGGAGRLTLPDREVGIVVNLTRPRLIVFTGLLSDEECDALVAESRPKLERSRTVNRASGETELNAARTSEGTYFHHNESPLLSRINARISALLRWPLEHGEPLQILHYGVGAEYQPHYDYFDPHDSGTPRLLAHGGQRVATLITYLNSPAAGGATVFPDIGLEVAPIKGNAVFFSYDRPAPETLTLHGGTPVASGEKWIATRWVREHAYL